MIECAESSSGFITPAIIGAIIGLVATIAGAGVTEIAARARATKAQKLDWNRRLFDKYADAYRDFLAGWGGAGNPELLRHAFVQLRSTAIVPMSVVQQYESAMKEMQGTQDPNMRAQVALVLQQSVEALLNDPLGLAGGS